MKRIIALLLVLLCLLPGCRLQSIYSHMESPWEHGSAVRKSGLL